MKPIPHLLCIPGLLFCTILAAQPYDLTVHIAGISFNKGVLYVSLFNTKDGFPNDHTRAFRVSHAAIVGDKCSILFEGIPKGEYAIACYHDENNNGKIDTNFLGIPKEGTGASNNAKSFMGPPKFNDAGFQVTANTTQEITMRY